MKIICNYLGSNLLKGVIVIVCLLLGIDILFYLVNELKIVGIGNYNLINAIVFVLLTIPRKIYIISPWAVLLGSLLVLGNMNKYNELMFLRCIGLSIHQIGWWVCIYIGIFTVGIFVLGEVLAPKIEIFAQNNKTLALSKGNAIYTSTGTWIRNKNKFIHVSAIQDQKILQDLVIYELDDKFQLKCMKSAETAKLINVPGSGKKTKANGCWELYNVIITDLSNLSVNTDSKNNNANIDGNLSINPDSTKINRHLKIPTTIKLSKIEKMQEFDLLDLNILHASNIKHLERLSMVNLARIIKERGSNNLSIIDYQIAYWKKIIQPFTILIMGYLSIPFVFGPLRTSSKGTYLLVGVLLGISFYLLNAFLVPLVTVIGVPAWLATILPPITFFAVGLALGRRTT